MSKQNIIEHQEENHAIPVMDWISNDHVINKVDPADLTQRKIIRSKIEDLADSMINSISDGALKKEDGSLKHYHTKGIYAREMLIPKGTCMVSKIHKLPRLCIILSGDISFTTEYGSQRVKGSHTAIFPPGSRVALFTHEDTVWTAIHGTDETDLEILESNLIAKDHGEYNDFCKSLGFEEGFE